MTEDDLLRALQSVGFAAFVAHLDLFRSHLDDATAVAALMQRSGWAETGCRTRVNRARAILNAGRLQDALRIVESAGRLDPSVRAAAGAARRTG